MSLIGSLGAGIGLAESEQDLSLLFPFYIKFLVILTMRTIVIWRHNRVIFFLLPTILAALWIPLLYFLNEALSSLVFGPAPRPDLPGCFLVTQKNILFLCFIIIMCFETCGFNIF